MMEELTQLDSFWATIEGSIKLKYVHFFIHFYFLKGNLINFSINVFKHCGVADFNSNMTMVCYHIEHFPNLQSAAKYRYSEPLTALSLFINPLQ